ncbi:hypothetical protein tpqmel_0136 [Candidatus Gastranaerophilus sp. (ex Termes propinquus)]|nr:hypothetical protein tpqmel_0136 [Candidatus Gastranaerophilus sp. (ex Termes propinquus)]
MGMSAGQARFLMLTAQKSNNEYEAQCITYERLVLARNTQIFTDKYTEAKNTRTMLFGNAVANGDGSLNYNRKLTYDDITRPFNAEDGGERGLGMRLATAGGRIVVRSEEEMSKYPDKNREDFLIDPTVDNPEELERQLRAGAYLLEKPIPIASTDFGGDESVMWQKASWENVGQIIDVTDKTIQAEAESEYDKKLGAVQATDKKLEMRLKQLEVEHKALETEIDSVKKVVDKNVEGSFKTFSA